MNKYILALGACSAVIASELFSEDKVNLKSIDIAVKSKETSLLKTKINNIDRKEEKKEEEAAKPSPFAFF